MKILLPFILIISAQFLTSCASKPVDTGTTIVDEPVVVAGPRRSLSWETVGMKHWKDGIYRTAKPKASDALIAEITKDLSAYSNAKDITEICPKYKTIQDRFKIKAIGEFWVALAREESNLKPNSGSIDVGSVSDRNSYSDGYYQMSGTDSAAKVYKCDFECLHDPVMNIKVATEQMRRQLKNTNEIILPNSSPHRYWAIILENNKYQRISTVKAYVLKYAPECK